MTCSECGGPAWTSYLAGGFIGSVGLLYTYAKLAGYNPRYKEPNVWGCDTCRIARPIHREARAGDSVEPA